MKSEYQVQHGIWILIDEIEKSQTPYTIDEYWFMLSIHLPNWESFIMQTMVLIVQHWEESSKTKSTPQKFLEKTDF